LRTLSVRASSVDRDVESLSVGRELSTTRKIARTVGSGTGDMERCGGGGVGAVVARRQTTRYVQVVRRLVGQPADRCAPVKQPLDRPPRVVRREL
jgi:hypothetical protein